jgi:hypothetical protein
MTGGKNARREFKRLSYYNKTVPLSKQRTGFNGGHLVVQAAD